MLLHITNYVVHPSAVLFSQFLRLIPFIPSVCKECADSAAVLTRASQHYIVRHLLVFPFLDTFSYNVI